MSGGSDLGFLLDQAIRAEERGDPATAFALVEQILAAQPDHLNAQQLRAVSLFRLGRTDECRAAFRAYLARAPEDAGAWFSLSIALGRPEDRDEAIDALRKAIDLRPSFIAARARLADLLIDQGRIADADAALDDSHLDPADQFPQAWAVRVRILLHGQRLAEADAVTAQAVTAFPDSPLIANYRGIVLLEAGEYAGAEQAFTNAITCDSENDQAWRNLGLVRAFQGALWGAIAAFDRAVSINPQDSEHRFTRSGTRLRLGQLRSGWDDYEHRNLVLQAPPGVPRWTGQTLAGKTIAVLGEQGLGDELMFITCLADLLPLAGKVIYLAEPRLATLLGRSFPEIEVRAHPRNAPIDPAGLDLWAPVGSLPRAFRTHLASFPARPRRLIADPARAAQWRDTLRAEFGGAPLIGISWRSLMASTFRTSHYTSLDQWGPIFAAAKATGARLINLQYDDPAEEIAAACARFGGAVWRPPGLDQLRDLDGTVALMAALDYAIVPANTVASMVGALGLPCTMLTMDTDWTSLGTDHEPWFPQMHVAARKYGEDWAPHLEAVAARIAAEDFTGRTVGDQPPLPSLTDGVEKHRAGDKAGAEAIYRAILASDPDHAPALQMLGLAAAEQGRAAEGLACLERAVELEPDVGTIRANLGALLLQAEQRAAAEFHLRAALEREPGLSGARLALGQLLMESDQTIEAAAILDHPLLHGHPLTRRAEAAACHAVGLEALEDGRTQDAITAFSEALAQIPDHAEALLDRAAAFYSLGRLADAGRDARAAAEARPDWGAPFKILTLVYLAAGHADAACQLGREAVRLTHDADPDAHAWFGQALQAAGHGASAATSFERALALDPDHPEARAGLRRLAS